MSSISYKANITFYIEIEILNKVTFRNSGNISYLLNEVKTILVHVFSHSHSIQDQVYGHVYLHSCTSYINGFIRTLWD